MVKYDPMSKERSMPLQFRSGIGATDSDRRESVGAEWALGPRKRALDLAGITVLMPLFVPAGAVIASKIHKRDHMNPIFSQTRYGLRLEPFKFYKFRTMPPDANELPSSGSNDNRRTALGKKLSESHLDEMPQTVNIYNGTMSMVGPRALILQDVVDTLDVLSPPEQKEWIRSRGATKPAVFGNFQLEQHVNDYESEDREGFLRTRAFSDMDYAAHASFGVDMQIVLKSALAAFDTLSGNSKDADTVCLRYESAASMFESVAGGFGVTVTSQEHELWRATLFAARCLDDIIDVQGVVNVAGIVSDLLQGRVIDGMTQVEAEAFGEAYRNEPEERQRVLYNTYMNLPVLAERKRYASSTRELLGINAEEADMFANMLFLDPTDINRIRFNRWITKFAHTGYLADLVLDSKRDYGSGNIAVLPSLTDRGRMLARTIVDSGRLIAKAPYKSYGKLAKGVAKTLVRA